MATVFRNNDRSLALISDSVTLDATTGEVLRVRNSHPAASLTQSVMAGLHYAQFGGYSIRWLYFLMGLAASASIATGLVLWTAKRRGVEAKSPTDAAGWRLVECFNVAGVAGFVVACLALFYANRLIPVNIADRAALEVRTVFAVWTLLLLHALLRKAPGRAWREQFWIAALLALGVPFLNALTGGMPFTQSVLRENWILTGFDSAALVCGILLAFTAWKIGRARTTTKTSLRDVGAGAAEGT